MGFDRIIRKRRSVRDYKPEQITAAELQAVLDAAQAGPVARGDYGSLRVTAVQDPALLARIAEECAMEKNGVVKNPICGAPTVIFVSSTGPSASGLEYANVAVTVENMILAATDKDLGSVYLWGFLKKLRECPDLLEQLRIPEGYEVLSAVGVGYPSEPLAERSIEGRISVDVI